MSRIIFLDTAPLSKEPEAAFNNYGHDPERSGLSANYLQSISKLRSEFMQSSEPEQRAR